MKLQLLEQGLQQDTRKKELPVSSVVNKGTKPENVQEEITTIIITVIEVTTVTTSLKENATTVEKQGIEKQTVGNYMVNQVQTAVKMKLCLRQSDQAKILKGPVPSNTY